MNLLTEQEARALLASCFVNVSAIAEDIYPGDPQARQKLYRRTSRNSLTEETLELLTMSFAKLYYLFPHGKLVSIKSGKEKV